MSGRKLAWLILIAMVFAFSGCGGYSSSSTTTYPPLMGQSAMVTVTITDTPPAGVTVLSFELTVNGATLNPGNVPLVYTPAKIEVRQLETESAFLSTFGVPTGTYQSVTFNFTNPELTILNQSGAAIGSCANNSVCELKPAVAGNVTFSGAPFPVALTTATPAGFQVDVNVANLITNTLTVDFNASGVLTVAQLPLPGHPADHLDDLDDLIGSVLNLDTANSKFTLHTATADLAIQANSNTQFEFESCAANNFSCLQNGLVVKVDTEVMAGGAFLAHKIEFEDDAADDELEGVVFKIDDATHIELAVLGELRSVSNVNIGDPIVVTLSNPTFEVKNDGLNVPSSLQGAFQSATDTSQLLPGQVVEIRATSPASTGPPITVTTDRVRLRMSQFTATVMGAPAPPSFTLGNLPALFTNAGISSIGVQTSSATQFESVTGVSALADQNIVSVRGLLFNNGANPPQLIADKVRKR
jgi:Domain of unknown function (DUF5666)